MWYCELKFIYIKTKSACLFSITKVRTEVIIQGTRNTTITPDNQGGKWEEYEFHCKPGQLQSIFGFRFLGENLFCRYIRAQHFEYEFTKVGSPIANTQWWTRKLIGEYLPIVDANTLKPFLRNQGWKL